MDQVERIAVTGASGFVGRHLLDRLVADAVDAVALSRRGTGRDDVDDVRIPDYTDAQSLETALDGASVVVHLAARAHQLGEHAAGAQALYDEANVSTALAVAGASRAVGARRFVFVSSIGVHGNQTRGVPFTVDDAPAPVEPYAISKWKAEQAIAAALRDCATDFVILRPPLVYGHGCPGNFAKLLELVAKAPVVPLGGVDAARSFVYVGNLVDAILVSARHPAASRRTFLICDSRALTVAEVVRTLAAGLGRSPRAVLNVPLGALDFAARLAGKPQALAKLTAELLVDGSAFSSATGWHAPISPEQGLRRMAEAHRAQRH